MLQVLIEQLRFEFHNDQQVCSVCQVRPIDPETLAFSLQSHSSYADNCRYQGFVVAMGLGRGSVSHVLAQRGW